MPRSAMPAGGALSQSVPYLKRLLVGFWIGSTSLLVLLFAALDLVERHREVLYDAEHSSDVVAASFAAPMADAKRQALIHAYAHSHREDQLDGMNVLLVVDRRGKIAYSSRSSWLGLQITDPQLVKTETNDPDFVGIADCYRKNLDDCVSTRSSDFRLRTGSFTVLRPIQLPQADIGLASQRMLVVINYDPGVVLADFGQDLLFMSAVSLLLSAVLTLALWSLLIHQLLPRLVQASRVDGLTGLANRAMFMEQAMELLAEAEERRGELVFAVLDIDHFKRINDTYGHVCGDEALMHVAAIFRAVIRPDDLICRFGGEEFALLLNGSRESAGRAIERLRLQLEMSRFNHGGHQLQVRASIGAVSTADCGYNLDYLYSSADRALYAAKKGGRNRVEWNDGRTVSRLAL